MTETGRTAKNILNDFHRYNRAENSRRKGGFGFNFDTDEGRRFADQFHMLKGLENICKEADSAAISTVLLYQEIHFPEELNDEQLLYYYSRKDSYARGRIRADEEYYGRLYLLELANELHHDSPGQALEAVFHFWDAIDLSLQSVNQDTPPALQSPKQDIDSGWHGPNPGSDKDESERLESGREYLRRLCLSFLIAHSDMAGEIRKGLVDRDLYWKYDLIGEIRQGRFARADLFVKKYARLLKPDEISGDKPFIAATWQAMPEVFSSLDRVFGDHTGHLFRMFLTAGEETSTEVEILPVRRRAFGSKRRIALADTCYLDSRPSYGSVHKERWERTEWTLKEGARDFLYVIHLYTESYLREYYRAPKRKRNADRFLKKKYLRTGDDRKVILAMKEVMRDSRFEQAIGEGVAIYMKAHPAPEKEGPVSRKQQARLLYQMDHEKPESAAAIDYERFQQARSDADSVLLMLHNEEIDYTRGGSETVESKAGSGPADTQNFAPVFTDDEKSYLTYLLDGKRDLAEDFLKQSSLSASLIMKNINAKALEIFDDVLLVREGGSVELIEDYMDELRSML